MHCEVLEYKSQMKVLFYSYFHFLNLWVKYLKNTLKRLTFKELKHADFVQN